MKIKLEICTGSVEDCIIAEKNGADRIELNSALQLGGLTPSHAVIKEVLQTIKIPVLIMIRPRPAGFYYSESDFKVMQEDIKFVLEYGAAGIVFGILDSNGEIDIERCKKLVNLSNGKETVFHRAFDVVPNPEDSLKQLIDIGFTRILTSGQKPKVTDGLKTIKELIKIVEGKIEILPGCGINPENAIQIIRETGCNQLHASLSQLTSDDSTLQNRVIKFSNEDLDYCYPATSPHLVKKMRTSLDNF